MSTIAASMRVHLSQLETEQWSVDEDFRVELKALFRKRAAARGRKFVQLFAASGVELCMVSV